MAEISASSLISPMDYSSSNYRKCNLLFPPHCSSFALRSHSNTINPRSSTPSATVISQAKPQPSFARKRFSKQKPKSGNLRLGQDDVPTNKKINKALAIIAKSGKYGKALSRFNELQLKEIELDLYTFSIAINCYCHLNQVGFGLSLLGGIFKRGYTPNVVTFTSLLNGLIAQDKTAEALSHFDKLQLQGIQPTLYTFNIAIKCYCHMNRVGFGFSLLGCILKFGYTPGVATFNTLLNGLIILDKNVEAVEFFEKIVKKGVFKPKVSMYGSFINRLCKMGNTGAAISSLRIAEDGGLKPNTTIYSMIIDRLCKDGMVDDGVNFLVEMNSKGIRANVVTYTSLIDGLCKHGKWKEVAGMLREMVDSSISPDVCTSTVLNRVGFGFSLLGCILKCGYTLDVATFDTLLNGLIILDKNVEAVEFFEKIVKKGVFKPNVSTYGSFINRLCKMGNTGAAISSLRIAEDGGLKPNTTIYSMIIDRLCKDGMVDDGVNFLVEMNSKGIRANVVTYTSLIDGLCNHGKWKEATGMLREMVDSSISPDVCTSIVLNRVGFGFSLLGCILKCGYTPDVATFDTLLNGLIIHDKNVEAVEFFEKIVKKGVFKPNVSTYGSFINRLCKMGNTGAAISFLRIAEDGGLKPNTTIYSMIIDRLCKDGMVDDGVNFLVEMKSKGIRASVVTYTSLIDGLCKHGKWKEATGMLREMVDSSISPNVCTSTVLVSAFCNQGMIKEAEELLEDMIARGVYPNVVTYSSLMKGYCLQGLMDEAMRLFNAMVGRGIHPDNYCYNTLIKGYCKNMKIDEAMHLFREMPLRDVKRDIVTFNIIVRGLVQIGRYTAAQEILNEMQAARQIPDPKTCGLLWYSLCQSGHIDEAMFLFRMMEKRGLRLDIVEYNVFVDAYRKNKTLDNARDLFTILPSEGSCLDDRTSLI